LLRPGKSLMLTVRRIKLIERVKNLFMQAW